MPVLPLVGSRILQPGRNSPSFSACSTILSPARSLIEPVGLRSSSLAQMRTSADGDNRGSPTSGVPPTEARRLSKRIASVSGAAGHGGEDDDLVAVAQRRQQPASEPDVLVVDVDVDEAAEVLAVDQPFPDARVV